MLDPKRKKIILLFLAVLVVALLFIVFYLYQKSKKISEPTIPPVTQESVEKDLSEFTPDLSKVKDPEAVEQELKSYQTNPDKNLSEDEVLKELNDPSIVPLPKSNP